MQGLPEVEASLVAASARSGVDDFVVNGARLLSEDANQIWDRQRERRVRRRSGRHLGAQD